MKTFNKILVANRGEIAVRIIKSARKSGIKTATIYAADDADSLHVRFADEAYLLEGSTLAETYLNIEKITEIAKKTGCEAIHPGYGFLAENPDFVKACEEKGIVFIGPDADVMRLMGNKVEARNFAIEHNIPVVQGLTGSIEEILNSDNLPEFPLLIKAAAGGGGKGMTVVYDRKDLPEALEATARQAKAYFGDPTVFVEKYIEQPRHIEVQIIADKFGNVCHLFERECTIQRRHQKIVEEAPSPTLTEEVRERLLNTAVSLAKAIKYTNAGTIEFLVDKNLNFYFLEMNTRVQVEHPVTEFITGIDIVAEQISIAAGNPLSFRQEDITKKGNAIECRIYAEDPENNFMPSPGKLTLYKTYETPNIRVDTGVTPETEIKSSYDPMIAKLIVYASDRDQAIKRMTFALENFYVHNIKTNIEFLKTLINTDYFKENRISVKFTEEKLQELNSVLKEEKNKLPKLVPVVGFALFSVYNPKNDDVWNRLGFWRNTFTVAKIEFEDKIYEVEFLYQKENFLKLKVEGKEYEACYRFDSPSEIRFKFDGDYYSAACSENEKGQGYITVNGFTYELRRKDVLAEDMTLSELLESTGMIGNEIKPPMPGRIVKINVTENQEVKKGDLLLILESMKMENQVLAPKDGKIKAIYVSAGQMVEGDKILLEFYE